jgi:hypothetical protein
MPFTSRCGTFCSETVTVHPPTFPDPGRYDAISAEENPHCESVHSLATRVYNYIQYILSDVAPEPKVKAEAFCSKDSANMGHIEQLLLTAFGQCTATMHPCICMCACQQSHIFESKCRRTPSPTR